MNAPLFTNNKERVFFFLFLLIILALTLSYKYYIFLELKAQKTPLIQAQVLLQYTKHKNNNEYFVLKLKSDFGNFYTTSKEDLQNIQGRLINLRVIFNKVSFLGFLRGFYAPSFNIILLKEKPINNKIKELIISQHNTQIMQGYYLSLFLAESLPKEWRSLVQGYGISHIFAISGYHAGILSAISFFMLGLFYAPLHKRYFPYRNKFYDLGFLALNILVIYYLFLTQSPSYLRAIALYGFGFLMFIRGINILKLETLFWCVAILLALFPSLIFSLGFYFSCMGVLYICLFCKYINLKSGIINKILYIALFNIFIFINMAIISYYFFNEFSYLSILSPIFTLLFVVYYPLVLFLHLCGYGGILDSYLLAWLAIDINTITLTKSYVLFLATNLLSLLAIKFKSAFFMLFILNLLFFCYAVFSQIQTLQ